MRMYSRRTCAHWLCEWHTCRACEQHSNDDDDNSNNNNIYRNAYCIFEMPIFLVPHKRGSKFESSLHLIGLYSAPIGGAFAEHVYAFKCNRLLCCWLLDRVFDSVFAMCAGWETDQSCHTCTEQHLMQLFMRSTSSSACVLLLCTTRIHLWIIYTYICVTCSPPISCVSIACRERRARAPVRYA